MKYNRKLKANYSFRKAVKLFSVWKIHAETFTNLMEFVKNYLVDIETLCHYQKQNLRYQNIPKILSYLNLIEDKLDNKSDHKSEYSSQHVHNYYILQENTPTTQ